MITITELLNDEELKKIAECLKKNRDALKNLTLEQVKAALANQHSLLIREGKEAELNEIKNLMTRLGPLDQKDWQDSWPNTHSPISYFVTEMPDNKPFLMEATGNIDQQKATLNEMTESYKKITGKEPTTTTYNNPDELPENLKDRLANKPFPMTVMCFNFADIKQLQQFHKETVTPLINEEKIKLINNAPQKSPEPEIQTSESPRLTFR